mgnify:CR=1 FL=1
MARSPDTAFNAPIPGESLTQPPGAAPYERPHQFSDADQALEYLFQTLTQPKASLMITYMLKKGATCEAIARSILFDGFIKGRWSPDLGLLIGRTTLVMIASIAEAAGIKNVKYTNPDKDFLKFIKDMGDAPIADSDMEGPPLGE